MKKRKKNKRESGQSLVEFALVLPIFLLLIMGIIDFGWLFYNYISVANSARNAARIACVEYDECCVPSDEGEPKAQPFTLNLESLNVGHEENPLYTEEEVRIADTVSNSITGSGVDKEATRFTINYTYDDDMRGNTLEYKVGDRYKGDVTVSVESKIRVLTPVLGVFSDDMQYNVAAKSTFKVEKQYVPDSQD